MSEGNLLFPRFNTRMSQSPVSRATANFARKHARISVIAAGAAAAGVLTAATASAGAAPLAEAADHVTTTAQANGSLASSHAATAFDAMSILKPGVPAAGTSAAQAAVPATGSQGAQLAAAHSAGTSTSMAPTAAGVPAFLTAPAVAPHVADTTHKAASQPVGKRATAAHAQLAAKPKPVAAKPKPVAAKPTAAAHTAKHVAKPVVKSQPAPPAKPYLFYDSVTPSALPAGQPAAVYADGTYAASPSQVNGHPSVFWIDTNGSDTHAGVLDVEPGDATPAQAAQWVDAKLSAHPTDIAVIYTMISDWGQVKADVAQLPASMQSHVQYWIADPTGYPHLVPGSTATQWYWGSSIDESTALGNFLR